MSPPDSQPSLPARLVPIAPAAIRHQHAPTSGLAEGSAPLLDQEGSPVAQW